MYNRSSRGQARCVALRNSNLNLLQEGLGISRNTVPTLSTEAPRYTECGIAGGDNCSLAVLFNPRASGSTQCPNVSHSGSPTAARAANYRAFGTTSSNLKSPIGRRFGVLGLQAEGVLLGRSGVAETAAYDAWAGCHIRGFESSTNSFAGALGATGEQQDELWVQWINIGISEDFSRTDPQVPLLGSAAKSRAQLFTQFCRVSSHARRHNTST
jgi:hypothetical protein